MARGSRVVLLAVLAVALCISGCAAAGERRTRGSGARHGAASTASVDSAKDSVVKSAMDMMHSTVNKVAKAASGRMLLGSKLDAETTGMNDASEAVYKAQLATQSRAGRRMLADKLNPETSGMNDASEFVTKATLATEARAGRHLLSASRIAGRTMLASRLDAETTGMDDASEAVYKAQLATSSRLAGRALLQEGGRDKDSSMFLNNQMKLSDAASSVAEAQGKIAAAIRMRLKNSSNQPK